MPTDDLTERAVREFAAAQPGGGPLFLETLDQEGSLGGLRFALDCASAEKLPVPESMIAAAQDEIQHLDQTNSWESNAVRSIRNSLKLLGVRELVPA